MKIDDVKAYEIIKKKDVKDLNSAGYLLRHKKTGARVFILSNDDRNKVFYIGFRTPPEDSCGTTHILEHTVLCGSSKYKAMVCGERFTAFSKASPKPAGVFGVRKYACLSPLSRLGTLGRN